MQNQNGDMFSYLGHFRQGRFAKEGHNDIVTPKGTKRQAYLVEHPVTAARQNLRGSVRAARLSAASSARQAGASRAGVRAAGQAARVAAKQNRRDVVGAARLDPNARGQELYAAGQARRAKKSRGGTYMP